MSRLEWTEAAVSGLEQLALSHSLPADTRTRIEASAAPLARFPRFGPQLRTLDDGAELRFLIGPWPWLLIACLYVPRDDLVAIVSIEIVRAAQRAIPRMPGGNPWISCSSSDFHTSTK